MKVDHFASLLRAVASLEHTSYDNSAATVTSWGLYGCGPDR